MSGRFWHNKKVLVTGGSGFVGTEVARNLTEKRGLKKEQIKISRSKQYDLRDFNACKKAVKGADIILHLAADVGGVGYSNSNPATQFKNCCLIDLNIFEAASKFKVEKLVAVSSSVAYPAKASSPLKEEYLFNGAPALSGYGFGFAKRNTVVLTEAYHQEKGLNAVVLLPNNAYGPGEKVDLESGHVIPSLIYKCLTQDLLVVWGDGKAVRDFLYVEDFAEGVLLAAEKLNVPQPVNLGSGVGISIKQLVDKITKLTGFKGHVSYDKTKPKGQPKRIVDITRARKLLGFEPKWNISGGLKETVEWIKKEIQ